MGFDVTYGPDAALVGQSGYLAGRGQYRQGQQQLRQQRQMQERSIAAQRESQIRSQQFQLQEANDYERRLAARREEELKLQQKGYELRYTKQQEMENAKINEGVQWVRKRVAEGRWTEKEGQAAIDQLEMQRMGIDKLPVLKKPDPFPDGKKPGQSWVQNGGLMTRDSKGNEKFLVPPPKFSMSDIAKMTESVRESLTKYDKEENPIPPSENDVQEAVNAQIKSFLNAHRMIIEEMSGQQQQEQPGIPQQGAPLPPDVQAMGDASGVRFAPGAPGGPVQPMPGQTGDMPRAEQRRMLNRQFPLQMKETPEGGYNIDRGVAPQGQAIQPPEQGVPETIKTLPKKVQEQLVKNEKKGIKKPKPIHAGDWVGNVWDRDQADAKIKFRDAQSAVITRAMATMNHPNMPKEVRTDLREAVQDLLKILKAADYEVPAANKHQFYSRAMTKEGVEKRREAEELSKYLIDFINNPVEFIKRGRPNG